MKSKGLIVPTTPFDVEYITLPLSIPNTPEWRGVFCGLLYSLSYGYWWDKNTGDWEEAKEIGYAVALRACQSMGICDEVADCIEDSETIREIIKEIVRQTIYNGGSGGSGTNLGQGVGSLALCTEDNIFGAVTGLVNYMIASIRDMLEILEVATNRFEFVLTWVGNFAPLAPVLATITEWVAWVQDNIAENFEASLTTALVDEYRCDLFCMYQENDCAGLTARQVSDYFLGRVGGEGLEENLTDLLNFFITGSWSGTQIVDVMMASAIGMMTVNLDWIPFVTIPSLYSFENVFALYADQPDNDWTVLCPSCATPTEHSYCWFVDGNTPAWVGIVQNVNRPAPIYNSVDKRFEALPSTLSNTGLFGIIEFDLGAEYTDVTIDVHNEKKSSRTSTASCLTVTVDGVSVGTGGTNTNTSVQSINLSTTPANGRYIRIIFNATSSNPSQVYPTAYSFIDYVKVAVTSVTSPFPPENCPIE